MADPANPRDGSLEQTLVVSEFFYSIQGESSWAGRPCAFVRLVGCNLSCKWCDATYTWKPGELTPEGRHTHTLRQILERVSAYGVDLVEVTGGEPLLQPATHELLAALCDRGYEVLLDTGGGVTIAGVDPRVRIVLDLKPPGSEQSDRMVWSNLEHLKPGLDEVKFVIADRADYEWSRRVTGEHGLYDRVRVIFQPVTPPVDNATARDWRLLRELAAWMLEDRCPATFQLQLHRILWPTAVKGLDEGYLGDDGVE